MAVIRTLTHDQARRFYDRLGALQDRQAFYEDRAVDMLRREGAFGDAKAVLEIGCGTGRVAEKLLAEDLPADARYVGFDQSQVMIDLARARLKRFGERARVEQTDGTIRFNVADASVERVVSTYVFDLLSEDDIQRALAEAQRVLEPGGLLCLTGLTSGCSLPGKALGGMWKLIHRVRPALVGGCRPLEIVSLLPAAWEVRFREVVEPFGVPSEVVIAEKKGPSLRADDAGS